VAMVEQLRAGERPTPIRGARLCSLKEMSMQLAGFSDVRDGALAEGPAGAPTLRGVTLAQEHGVAVADFDPDTPITKTKPLPKDAVATKAEAAGVAANKPASDAKPAGDARPSGGEGAK